MKIRKEKLGFQDHPDLLISMSHIALTYQKQGRQDEAEKLQVQVMEARKEKLGPNHQTLLLAWKQGRWDEVEKL
ncbi:hypothetical protein F5887DRAFT_1080226 [Amanita rubescens]|nr:hypothetical protein F5887DRAFT_1080226 [Amanita rubescens]